MSIDGLSQYGGLYNSYLFQNIKTVTMDTIKSQEDLKKTSDESENITSLQNNYSLPELEQDNRSRIANLENISLTFNKADDFDFIGKDSSIETLDMEKAISDMQKDQVLQQYQYFVGSSQNIISNSMDGLVIQK
ncbi:MAG TPA: hypothetical protein VJZ04_05870 [Lachnospiraceae bacterium]|nr:hypothetical protein [Lachnospiraceae bacterium]